LALEQSTNAAGSDRPRCIAVPEIDLHISFQAHQMASTRPPCSRPGHAHGALGRRVHCRAFQSVTAERGFLPETDPLQRWVHIGG
jgi:hypothetical protein